MQQITSSLNVNIFKGFLDKIGKIHKIIPYSEFCELLIVVFLKVEVYPRLDI